MGNFLRLAVFILALGALAAGTAAMLLHESQRERALERLVQTSAFAAAGTPDAPPPDLVPELRARHARTQRAILLFGGLSLACVLLLAIVPARAPAAASVPDSTTAHTEMRGLETLARATVAQRAELDQEREARHRSEQNLTLHQLLANRALQDKIRLGRDLHDGLVQTLYAAGLVLETAAQQLAASPPAAESAARLLERAKTTLNAAIRQARGTIGDLTPDALDQQSFPEAVAALLDHLDAPRRCDLQLALDPALPVFPDPVRTELLQIIRESVSNALRHGAATRLEIAFAPLPDTRLRLVVRDDGRGFDPAAVTRGHGLDNLAARARSLGAQLDIDSAPGHGAVITLVLAAPAPSV